MADDIHPQQTANTTEEVQPGWMNLCENEK